ncbi:MAG: type II secretion system F family protein [Microthrixaceae bacterium]|nr:type II secretion system F family protein [Microthrixaceae bacterium]
MTSFVLAALAAIGTYLLLTGSSRNHTGHSTFDSQLRRFVDLPQKLMTEAGIEGVSPVQFLGSSMLVGLIAAISGAVIFGFGISSVLIGCIAAVIPAFTWRNRRAKRHEVAREAWPRMLDELRVLTGAAGRPIPQALLEVGLRGPVELRPAFLAAQREWALTTDFDKTASVLKERLADPTADVVMETLLVAMDVGGDLEPRLAALAEDRRQDEADRKDARAKQSGARFARLFVIIVPAGMALAGLNVGDGADAYRSTGGQALVCAGMGLVAVCWVWASRIMSLPEPSRVFDK